MCWTCNYKETNPDYINEKECKTCCRILTLDKFQLRGKKKRPRSTCKDCSKQWHRELYQKYKGQPRPRKSEEEKKQNYELSLARRKLKQLNTPENQLESLAVIAVSQPNCAICGIPKEKLPMRLAVDHCHATGKIRGFLCNSCNSALGYAKDDTKILQKMIEYLNNNGAININNSVTVV